LRRDSITIQTPASWQQIVDLKRQFEAMARREAPHPGACDALKRRAERPAEISIRNTIDKIARNVAVVS